MATNVSFTYEGDEYTLEYNENAIRMLDKQFDFSLNSIEKVQLSDVPTLFFVALRMHHPRVVKKEADAMYAKMGNKTDLLAALVEMYAEAVQAIIEEPEEGEALSWKKNEA